MDPDLDLTSLRPLALADRPWAMRRDTLTHLAAADWRALAAAGHAARPMTARGGASQRAGGAVAVIPLTGVITPQASFLSWLFGGSSLLDFRDQFREAIQSPDVGAIVIDVDSPGGVADLVAETAQEIYDARGTKPIVAIANTMAASAAYWIASQADELVVTPSGQVGSVGVYMLHEDWSGWNTNAGIDPSYVVAGGSPRKVDGNVNEPLSDEARTEWQEKVDDIFGSFADAVARGRGITAEQVRDGYGEGRTLLAPRALAAGMIDRIDTIETVIGDLLAPSGTSGDAAASARRGAFALTLARAASTQDTAPAASATAAEVDDAPPPSETAEGPEQEEESSAIPAGERARAAALLVG